MSRSLSPKATRGVSQRLKKANRLLARGYPAGLTLEGLCSGSFVKILKSRAR